MYKLYSNPIQFKCSVCYAHEESIDHILLHCEKTRVLWELLFSIFGVYWVIHSTVTETLLGWHDFFVGRKQKKVWRTTPLCLFWTIWKERNRRYFKKVELFVQRLKFLFCATCYLGLICLQKIRLCFQSILLIGWGRIEGGSVFVFPILFGALWGQCIHRVYFGAPLLMLLYKYYSHLFIIRNETEFVSVFLSYNIVFLFGDFLFFSPPKKLEWKAFR